MNKTEKMVEYSKKKTIATQQKAIDAINQMVESGEPITYYSVRQKTGISKSFLYNNAEVNALIKQHLSPEKTKITSPEHKDLLKAKREIKQLKARIKELEAALAAYETK